VTFRILVTNIGLFDVKQLNMGTIEPEDLPNTAKSVTIGMSSANDAILIKTDPQMVGDIKGSGGSATVAVHAKVSANATNGEYVLPLSVKYRYPKVMNQEVADIYEFTYYEKEDVIPVTVRIKPHVKIEVLEAVPDDLYPGAEGKIFLKIKNIGLENGEKAVVSLLRNGKSPIIPVESSLFIGNFSSGGTAECWYKIAISKDATNQTYPVDVVVSYTNREGSVVTSSAVTVGVPVNTKPAFTVVSETPEISTGTSRSIDVLYRNDGRIKVYDAQARIDSHDTVFFTDNDGFIGDMEPGAIARVSYIIEADGDAPPGTSTFSSTIRFRDAQGVSIESDPVPVQVSVISSPAGSSAIIGIGIIAGIALLCIVLLVYQRKKKAQ